MTETIFARPVFAVAGRRYEWSDVALASILWGDWAKLETEVREGIACAKRSEELGTSPPADMLDAAAAMFRYERDLVSAQAMYAWLEARALTVKAWLDYVRRLVLRRDSPDVVLDAAARYPATEAEVFELIPVDAFCSGHFDRIARKLAGRAAAFDRVTGDAGDVAAADNGEIRKMVESVSAGAAERAIPDLSPELSRERLAALARLELGFQRFRSKMITGRAVADRVTLHALDWMRFNCRTLALPDEQAAREAALCLREDGVALCDVATMAHARLRDTRFYVHEVDAALREHFLGAQRGELLGPLPTGGEFVLFEIVDKVPPREDDPEIRHRAEEAVLRSALTYEIDQRVRWEFPM
jgi:hypothetical protein